MYASIFRLFFYFACHWVLLFVVWNVNEKTTTNSCMLLKRHTAKKQSRSHDIFHLKHMMSWLLFLFPFFIFSGSSLIHLAYSHSFLDENVINSYTSFKCRWKQFLHQPTNTWGWTNLLRFTNMRHLFFIWWIHFSHKDNKTTAFMKIRDKHIFNALMSRIIDAYLFNFALHNLIIRFVKTN